MANFQGHLTAASVLGAAYGAAGVWAWDLDWGPAFLAAGLTAVGGMLPDLDSDSGVPVRELSGLAAAVLPLFLIRRLLGKGFNWEQVLVILGGAYLLVRYVGARLFKDFTAHRGMFHSLPALAIAGLALFLVYQHPELKLRLYLAGAVMVGFLSHLLLDEMYAVDFTGLTFKQNQFAGSALKLTSKSWLATAITYLILLALASITWLTWDERAGSQPTAAVQIIRPRAPTR